VNPEVSLIVAVIALVISALTGWLTLVRRGTIRMTRPTVIYFGPDSGEGRGIPKVYFRALLYSTSKRGQLLESMYVKLSWGESSQNFNVWVYGDKQLERGSGLFVPETGFVANHHFLIPRDGSKFEFCDTTYRLDVYASLVGKRAKLLCTIMLEISRENALALKTPDVGLYFDWGADSARYHPHVKAHPKQELPDFLRQLVERK